MTRRGGSPPPPAPSAAAQQQQKQQRNNTAKFQLWSQHSRCQFKFLACQSRTTNNKSSKTQRLHPPNTRKENLSIKSSSYWSFNLIYVPFRISNRIAINHYINLDAIKNAGWDGLSLPKMDLWEMTKAPHSLYLSQHPGQKCLRCIQWGLTEDGGWAYRFY